MQIQPSFVLMNGDYNPLNKKKGNKYLEVFLALFLDFLDFLHGVEDDKSQSRDLNGHDKIHVVVVDVAVQLKHVHSGKWFHSYEIIAIILC